MCRGAKYPHDGELRLEIHIAIGSHTSVSGRTIAVGAEIPLRISECKTGIFKEHLQCFSSVNSLTKLDSSGEAKLNNKTLTFTVKVPKKNYSLKRQFFGSETIKKLRDLIYFS